MRTTEKQIKDAVENLQANMHEAGILPSEMRLRLQIGSAYYGNSNWVAVTGGEYGTGVDPIDALHLPSNATRAQFYAVITAYNSALYAVKRGGINWLIIRNKEGEIS